MYSAPTIANSQAFGVRLIDVGHMLDNFHVEYNIVAVAGIHKICSCRETVVDIEALPRRVHRCNTDVLFDNINARHRCAESCHGFGQDASAAANVEDAQSFERKVSGTATVEVPAQLLANIGESQIVELVQWPEGALAVPPRFGHA